MDERTWQGLYEALAHGDREHHVWLRGIIQGFASRHEMRTIRIEEITEREPEPKTSSAYIEMGGTHIPVGENRTLPTPAKTIRPFGGDK